MAKAAVRVEMVGRCLCGDVTVTIGEPRDDVGVCHCRTCRRWTSGPWMALQAPEARVEGEQLRIYHSSRFAERGFCAVCGTHIFHRPKTGPELAVSAGLFDTDDLHIAREIFTDNRPVWYRFVADSVKRTQLSMMAEWLPRMLWRKLTGRAGRGTAAMPRNKR